MVDYQHIAGVCNCGYCQKAIVDQLEQQVALYLAMSPEQEPSERQKHFPVHVGCKSNAEHTQTIRVLILVVVSN